MRRLSAVIMGASLVILPGIAFAQQQSCEQRAAIMGQLIEDMTRQRAVVSAAEVEAASGKVQIKELQGQIKGLQAEVEKGKQDAAKAKEPEKAK